MIRIIKIKKSKPYKCKSIPISRVWKMLSCAHLRQANFVKWEAKLAIYITRSRVIFLLDIRLSVGNRIHLITKTRNVYTR